jgi:hypothetical protein
MPLPLTNRWVTLTFEWELVRYSDERGIRRQFSSRIDFSRSRIEAPALWPFLSEILSAHPIQRQGPHVNGPVPLAAFINSWHFPEDAPWQTMLEESWSEFGAGNRDRLQTVLLARRLPMSRPPFRLPLRILSCGTSGAAALSRLESASWIGNLPDMAQFGLQIRNVSSSEFLVALQQEERDIVIAGIESVSVLNQACATLARRDAALV